LYSCTKPARNARESGTLWQAPRYEGRDCYSSYGGESDTKQCRCGIDIESPGCSEDACETERSQNGSDDD
jgi:hypothetical protein